MLKDVGMTVPKSRETSAVYISQYAATQGKRDFICSKTGDEGSINAARHAGGDEGMQQ